VEVDTNAEFHAILGPSQTWKWVVQRTQYGCLPVVHSHKIVDVMMANALMTTLISIFTQHARRAYADEATTYTDSVGQPTDVNGIRVMMASSRSSISEGASNPGLFHGVSNFH
jgi:hypothetical protein